LRKTVTVVFCDLVGSTALAERLDAEALRHLLGRYYAGMRAVLERHGGLVEKFIGDAVVAVFGVPVVHEDDALRAVRAAVEMRTALDHLNNELERESGVRLGVRIGVNTGDVVAGDLGPGASFASGDAVNVAARLEQAARPGEILIGSRTRRLLAETVQVERVEALELHGKSEPVEAYELLTVAADAEAIVRRFETTFVGRDRQLEALSEVFEETLAEPGCRLVTVLGESGIGKTRLLREFAGSVSNRACVVSGSCLPYGEGITYWPLAEIVHDLCQGEDLHAELASWLAGDERGQQISGLILGAIGAFDTEGAVEEVQWAARKLFEAVGAKRPLVALLEDLHWAEPTFLQLVEYVAECASGTPLLLLAAAREELLDTSPGWAMPHPHSQLLRLEPLSEPEAGRLIDGLTSDQSVPERMRARLLSAGGGNPLFLEQLVALRTEDGNQEQEPPLPPTITALLAARLDRLSTAERDVLERAAVEGVAFHRGTVTALLRDHETRDLGALLLDAVRRNLIRSAESRFPGDEGYRFVHVLVRNAVYEAMPKELRAQLHEQFADRLEQTLGAGSGEIEEVLGYHLEQAAHAKQELGRPYDALAERAGERLARAGRRALWRGDYRSAASLLERTLDLTRHTSLDVGLEVDLADAVGAFARPRAVAIAEAAAQRAGEAGDEAGEALARVAGATHGMAAGAEIRVDEVEALAHAALPLLEQAQDHAGLVHVWWTLGFTVANMRQRFDDMAQALEQALRHARLAGQRRPRLLAASLYGLGSGARPVDEALRKADEVLAEQLSPLTMLFRATALAMLGRFEEAGQIAAEASGQAREFGSSSIVDSTFASIYRLAGDHESAAQHLRRCCDEDEEHGERSYLSSYTPALGRELCVLGAYDEAERLARKGRELAMPDDAASQMLWRQVQALVHAHRGEHTAAEALAYEAIEISEQTDALNLQGDALCDLGQVLEAAGRPDAAVAAYKDALERYERKQNLAMVAQVGPRLAALNP
jgi:class 3 adenylate cyclase/tetratricopeptide (TPR) repeat protein